jgi:hypothetical protein
MCDLNMQEDTETTNLTKSISSESEKLKEPKHDAMRDIEEYHVNSRHKVKTKMRKEAKRQQKLFRKSAQVIPHLSSMIA